MSRKQKGGKKHSNLGDITLNDFANAAICTHRPKKTHINAILEDLKVEDKPWDEKGEGDYDGEFTKNINKDGSISYVISKSKEKVVKGDDKIKKEVVEGSFQRSYDLPIDVWFVIGRFIKPEDVGRFARICKASYSVVCGAKFWVDLYKKYYNKKILLPEDLKPDHLNRKFGVRTLTVRALYSMYPPFINRIHRLQRTHPKDCLIKRKCTLMWHSRKQKDWAFYFKLEELELGAKLYQEQYKSVDLIEKLDDVFVNPDENCKILLVNSQSFIAIPPVQNYVLCDVNVSLTTDLSQQRVKLRFSSHDSYQCRRYLDGASNIEFTIGSVINYKVLDWWHPEYPRTNTLEIFLNGD
ncbi:transmembrane protein 183A [Onthophagus taurus]|uniref:transmembrane protein 183A n=1 Tax=Onthophagus taurus TaxID=166361 RepID=UPI0039BE1F92